MSDAAFLGIGCIYVLLGLGIGLGGWKQFGAGAKVAFAMLFPVHTFLLALHDDARSSWIPHGLSMIGVGLLSLCGIGALGIDGGFLVAMCFLLMIIGLLRMTEHGNDRGPLW